MTVTNKDIIKWKNLVYKIVNKYRQDVFKYRTYIDWDEMEQVGMIALYNALEKYDSNKGGFKNYAIIAIIRAMYRQLQFDTLIERHYNIDNFYSIVGKDDIEFDIVDKPRLINRIKKIIDQLPIKDSSKTILRMRLEGYTLNEIADKVGLSFQGVSWVINFHKDKIKKKLTGGATND